MKIISAGVFASNTDWQDFLNQDVNEIPESSPLLSENNLVKGGKKVNNKKRKHEEITGGTSFKDEIDEEEYRPQHAEVGGAKNKRKIVS